MITKNTYITYKPINKYMFLWLEEYFLISEISENPGYKKIPFLRLFFTKNFF